MYIYLYILYVTKVPIQQYSCLLKFFVLMVYYVNFSNQIQTNVKPIN